MVLGSRQANATRGPPTLRSPLQGGGESSLRTPHLKTPLNNTERGTKRGNDYEADLHKEDIDPKAQATPSAPVKPRRASAKTLVKRAATEPSLQAFKVLPLPVTDD